MNTCPVKYNWKAAASDKLPLEENKGKLKVMHTRKFYLIKCIDRKF
jgi:hypothetical protein